MKNRYEIREMHICKFENKNGLLTSDLNVYPSRLCILDKTNRIVIDVETGHKYPYLKITNMSYLNGDSKRENIDINKRYSCLEYASLLYSQLDSRMLNKCEEIIKLLNNGHEFPNGNDELTNEQYLEMLNSNKKTKNKEKKFKKRK